jgi:hypothetical protein
MNVIYVKEEVSSWAWGMHVGFIFVTWNFMVMSITSDLTNGSKKKKVFPKDSKAIILYKIKI